MKSFFSFFPVLWMANRLPEEKEHFEFAFEFVICFHYFQIYSSNACIEGAICQWIHYEWRKNGFYLLIVWFFVPFFSIFFFGSCRSWKNERLFDSFEVVICWQKVQNCVWVLHNKHFDETKGLVENWEFHSRISLAWLFKTHYNFIISIRRC